MTTGQRWEVVARLTERSAAIAEAWFQGVSATSFPAVGSAALRHQLTGLTQRAITLLGSEPIAPAAAQAIGAELAALHLLEPAALRTSLAVLGQALVTGLTPEQLAELYGPITALLSEVAAGFFERASAIMLAEQEAIRTAVFDARAQAEAAWRASEARLRTVVTNAPIVLFTLDRAGVFTLLVGQGLAALGLTEGELVGRSAFEVYQGEPAILEHVRQALAGAALTVTTPLQGRVFETRYTPLWDAQGVVSGTIGVATDITERQRAAEAQLALDQLKADFVANISHELRTPLHHIKGYAALLRMRGEHLDAATHAEFLDTIEGASDQLGRLIDDLVDTSRMARGALTVVRVPLRLDGLVQRVVQRWAGIGSHAVRLALAEAVPLVVADGGRIEQVLDNLLTNVVRYTPAGTAVEVGVGVTPGAVVVRVADQGPGVASEHLPHLFERFYQVPAAVGPQRGSGLGLAICQWIVEQHGGQIWAEGTPGGGLTIQFSLPRVVPGTGLTPEAAAGSGAGGEAVPDDPSTVDGLGRVR